MAGSSMLKYVKAKSALKTVFTLLRRVPLIDVSSVKGIILVCYLIGLELISLCMYVHVHIIDNGMLAML